MKCKHYEVVIQKDYLKVDIQEVLKKYTTIKKWAYILHDKDDTNDHFHVYVNFGQASVDSSLVAEWFQVKENYVEKIKGRATDMLSYLTHSNDSQKHKYQYPSSEVIANFDIESEIEASKIIGDFEHYSYAEMLKYVNTLTIDNKTKLARQLKTLWELQCKIDAMKTTRNISVVFVTGKSGTGKTYYAKKLLESLNYDYCVSSSSNDPFQDYLGQKAMLFDDLRFKDGYGDGFSFDDLLKVLDNNTNSSIKSRFNNKVFNGKMIIITSSIPIKYWYPSKRYSNDSLDQLYRRINLYVEVLEKDILVYNSLDDTGKPKGEPKRYYNEVYDLKKEFKTEDLSVLFDKICTPKPLKKVISNGVTLTEVVDDGDLPF